MKKNGFTLVELLASMVILGILMAITIPNIMGIMSQNKNEKYLEDAKKLVSAAKYKYASTEFVKKKLKANECYKMTLKYLNNGEFDETPNGGEYDKNNSYVILRKDNSGKTNYYVTITENNTKEKICMTVPLTKYEDLTANEGDRVEECGASSGVSVSCPTFVSGSNLFDTDAYYNPHEGTP